MKASLCRAHGHVEVEHSLSTNKKLSTMNVLCCQMRQTTKDAIRVTGHGQAHAMSITQSLMHACRSAYSVYKTRRRGEKKVKKAKEQRLNDQGKRMPKNKRKPSCLWRGRSEDWKMEKNLSVRNRRNARSKWLGVVR